MVGCATSALERHIIHAERVLFFLVDKPRGELWLHTSQSESMRLRVGPQGGVVGLCAESKKPQSWAVSGGDGGWGWANVGGTLEGCQSRQRRRVSMGPSRGSGETADSGAEGLGGTVTGSGEAD